MTKEQAREIVRMIFGQGAANDDDIVHWYFEVNKTAMEEFAKQQAIAFDIWKRENCINYDYENKAYSKLVFLDVDHTKVRTEQLSIDDTYSQFIENQSIEQQNKQ